MTHVNRSISLFYENRSIFFTFLIRVLIICLLDLFVFTRFSSKHQSVLLTRLLSLLTRFIFMLTRFLTMLTRYAKLVIKHLKKEKHRSIISVPLLFKDIMDSFHTSF